MRLRKMEEEHSAYGRELQVEQEAAVLMDYYSIISASL